MFSAVTDYGGGVGEILGVSSFMALLLGRLCNAALAGGILLRWLALPGVVSAALLAAGVWLLRRR